MSRKTMKPFPITHRIALTVADAAIKQFINSDSGIMDICLVSWGELEETRTTDQEGNESITVQRQTWFQLENWQYVTVIMAQQIIADADGKYRWDGFAEDNRAGYQWYGDVLIQSTYHSSKYNWSALVEADQFKSPRIQILSLAPAPPHN